MWWIFGLAIWVMFGIFACEIFKIDWRLSTGMRPNIGGDVGWMYALCIILPPIGLITVLTNNRKGGRVIKIFFERIGGWFKNNMNWKW
jgi:hypothetical protein